MFKLVVVFVLFSVVCIQMNECFYRPENGPPPPKPLDIKIYGESVKFNIYEIQLGNGYDKGYETIKRLREQFSINRRKRSADSTGNSVMNTAKDIWNKTKDNMKNLADKVNSMADKAKSTFENVKGSFSGKK